MDKMSKLNFLDGKFNIGFDQSLLSNSLFFTLISVKDINASIFEEIKRVKNDLRLIESAIIALNNIEDIILLIRKSDDVTATSQLLCDRYVLTKAQSLFILDLELTELNVEIFTSRKNILVNYLEFLKCNLKK